MFLTTLRNDLVSALKAGDSARVETLRFLLAAIKNFEIDKHPPSIGGEISDEEILSVISKQVKTHKESIEMFKKASRDDLVRKESAQLAILENYLPKQLTDFDIKDTVEKIKTKLENEKRQVNFGLLMSETMKMLKGKAEGGLVAQVVKEVLS